MGSLVSQLRAFEYSTRDEMRTSGFRCSWVTLLCGWHISGCFYCSTIAFIGNLVLFEVIDCAFDVCVHRAG